MGKGIFKMKTIKFLIVATILYIILINLVTLDSGAPYRYWTVAILLSLFKLYDDLKDEQEDLDIFEATNNIRNKIRQLLIK